MKRTMSLPALTCALLVPLIGTSLRAQAPATAAPGAVFAAGGDDMAKMKDDIATINANIAKLTEMVAKITNDVEGLKALESVTRQNSADIQRLEQKFNDEFTTSVEDLRKQFNELQEIVADISTKTPEGLYVPNLGQLQVNQPFGKVTVRNQMTTRQRITVNGIERWVEPYGGQVELDVRPGMVSTTLPGYEGPKSWHLGPANAYRLEIQIIPRS